MPPKTKAAPKKQESNLPLAGSVSVARLSGDPDVVMVIHRNGDAIYGFGLAPAVARELAADLLKVAARIEASR